MPSLRGGSPREEIRTYHTGAGTAYRQEGGPTIANYGLSAGGNQYADLDAFLNRADDLAEELLADGITAMKIWPFDAAAERTNGQYTTAAIGRAHV